jgi:hypothetical protein
MSYNSQTHEKLTKTFKSAMFSFVATDPYPYCATVIKLTLPPQSLIGLVQGFRVTPKPNNLIYWHTCALTRVALEYL